MSVSPVSGTRISVPLQTQQLVSQMSADQLSIQSYYDQLSTGRRIQRMGDDPVVASRAIGLQNSIRYGEQLVRNADQASAFYAATDETLSQIDDALIEAKSAAVAAAQGVLTDDERESIAVGIRQSIDQVLAGSNATFRDHQLLGGILSEGPAFVQEGSTVLFTGTQATGTVRAASGIDLQGSLAISEALGSSEPIVEGASLNSALDGDTRLVDAHAGKGVTTGVIRISDGSGWQEVDLTNAATFNDVKEILESVSVGDRKLSMTILNDGFQLEYEDGLPGTLAVDDLPGGTMAQDLNIENANGSDPPPLVAGGLTPKVTLTTKLSTLAGGAGLDVSAGLQIQQGEQQFVVDLSEAETLGDVVIAINRSGADVQAVLDETGGSIDIQARRAGVDYAIGENGGQAATNLGIRSSTRETTLASLGHDEGILMSVDEPELTILRPDGTQLDLELENLRTVGDVLDAINDHPDNQDTRRIVASLATHGNGIQLVAPPGADPITVRQPSNGTAGLQLGLIPADSDEATGATEGGVAVLLGEDYSPKEAGGAIDSLLRLEAATRAGDVREIGRLQAKLDEDLDQSVSARGRVGVWSQNLDILRDSASNQVVSLNEQLSEAIDTDFAAVVTDLNSRQTSLEASMRLVGQMAQLSVLNFL
ncbi:flagellin N-terminal helical domain-containing protein [Roseimaritima ulvae]|uniref:Flagellin n=1 Tax=Roseimaritima ulvae TaxID=980254 RepID=A0A5B9QYS7_9BACT|nr:flagellin [Roseimaritima ulvae]QEG39151.1 Flagellar hook-associated protein 3 [Roseimaritima ulvae]